MDTDSHQSNENGHVVCNNAQYVVLTCGDLLVCGSNSIVREAAHRHARGCLELS